MLAIETTLAKASLTRVELRDPQKLHHVIDLRRLQALTPGFNWSRYVAGLGLAGTRSFNVTEPAFMKALNTLILTRSLADLKTYLRWHLAHQAAPYLAPAFVAEDFDFFQHTLHGVPQQSPRWQGCVTLIDKQLGEALGQEFVRSAFSPALKARTVHMTQQIEDAMAARIKSLDWMSHATTGKALEKLHAIANKIGYPERWRDYSSVEIRRDDFFGNVLRASSFEQKRQLAKIRKPVDRGEWVTTPQTVNAYYDAPMNDITFPAGILQPPLFDPAMDDAPNYGNTGGTIGHELTHGFDGEGRQYDAKGNLKNWWSKKDEQAFNERTQCLIDQYAQYTVVDDIKINSKLTLGEDLADPGGLVLALVAWKAEIADNPPPDRDGYTPMQRFFIGMAQWGCENSRAEDLRVRAATDTHSPNKYRVNGLVANFPEFEQAFACKPGQAMAPVKRCKVW